MGIQDRDYMREGARNRSASNSSNKKTTRLPIFSSPKILAIVRWLCIFLILVLAVGLYNKPSGLYQSCDLSPIMLDSNRDGLFSYDDIPITVAQLVRYPIALLIKYPQFNQVDSFFKIKKGACNSAGAIAFTSIAWVAFGYFWVGLFYFVEVASRGKFVFPLSSLVLTKNFVLFVALISLLSHLSISNLLKPASKASKSARIESKAPPKLEDKEQVRMEVLRLVNAARNQGRNCGPNYYLPVGPLVLRDELNMAAYDHASDMAKNNYFSHTSPNGGAPSDRARKRGYVWTAVGENIGKGYRSAGHVVRGWLDSPGHCQNIMNPRYSHMGLDYEAGKGGVKYWVQKFGSTK